MSTEVAPLNIAETLSAAYKTFIEHEERRSRQMERPYVYASSWRLCTRQMALEMITPGSLKPFETNTLANFRRGKDRERDIRTDLARVGRESDPPFEVVGQEERFELRDHKGRVVIVGKVDAQIQIGRQRYPLEIKSWNPNLVARIETFEDLFSNRWTRSGAHQLLAYLLAMEQPEGIMLLDRNGLPLPLLVRLDENLHRIEDFLARAEVAMDAKHDVATLIGDENLFLPPFINNPDECKMCGFFGSVCNPPISYPGADIIVDEETIQKTERYADLLTMPELDEFAELDKWAKGRFRGVEQAIVGKCVVSGKWQKDTKYSLTDEVRASIDAIKKPFAEKIEKGKYFLTVKKAVPTT